jgi:hypothetical protein
MDPSSASGADSSNKSELKIQELVVGAIGFEPMTPCAQGRCATRLRYAPTLMASLILNHFQEAGHRWDLELLLHFLCMD